MTGIITENAAAASLIALQHVGSTKDQVNNHNNNMRLCKQGKKYNKKREIQNRNKNVGVRHKLSGYNLFVSMVTTKRKGKSIEKLIETFKHISTEDIEAFAQKFILDKCTDKVAKKRRHRRANDSDLGPNKGEFGTFCKKIWGALEDEGREKFNSLASKYFYWR